MQSPLTPQRGRIESNPREYTHMGPRPCGELETMPADWAKGSRAAARAWKIGHSPNESGYSDGRARISGYLYEREVIIWELEFRQQNAPKTVQISTLDIRPSENPRSSITRVSLVPHSSLI